jgi:hypothetical protein
MSFSMTTDAVRNQTKTVTRRLGWDFLKPGDLLMACEKCQGLGKGGKVVRMGLIRVTDKRPEALSELERLSLAEQALEMRREGFPHMTVPEFIAMFTEHNDVDRITPVNRIEFEYVDGPDA